jgi:hypothetical protein
MAVSVTDLAWDIFGHRRASGFKMSYLLGSACLVDIGSIAGRMKGNEEFRRSAKPLGQGSLVSRAGSTAGR